VYAEPKVKAFNQLDLQISRDIEIAGSNMNVYVDVENILDPDVPLYQTLTSNPGFSYPVPNNYPIFGRFFSVGIRGKF
jgi:outer membrane receptor protein involved in Fe transport